MSRIYHFFHDPVSRFSPPADGLIHLLSNSTAKWIPRQGQKINAAVLLFRCPGEIRATGVQVLVDTRLPPTAWNPDPSISRLYPQCHANTPVQYCAFRSQTWNAGVMPGSHFHHSDDLRFHEAVCDQVKAMADCFCGTIVYSGVSKTRLAADMAMGDCEWAPPQSEGQYVNQLSHICTQRRMRYSS